MAAALTLSTALAPFDDAFAALPDDPMLSRFAKLLRRHLVERLGPLLESGRRDDALTAEGMVAGALSTVLAFAGIEDRPTERAGPRPSPLHPRVLHGLDLVLSTTRDRYLRRCIARGAARVWPLRVSRVSDRPKTRARAPRRHHRAGACGSRAPPEDPEPLDPPTAGDVS
ncbi:MAG: hypothetical protein H0V79_05220 [Actinobacteria bacterium]|nr:hypothetical protein [Actinomycetota bacterium]